MAQIGEFTRTTTGFFGHIRTLALEADLCLVPINRSGAENTPDYRIHLGDEHGPEIGAGWKRTGEQPATMCPCNWMAPRYGSRSAPTCSKPATPNRPSICCGIVRRGATRGHDPMRVRLARPIPVFDRKPVNPCVPIGCRAAIARSVGQGRLRAGARALPLTEASPMACFRPFRDGAGVGAAILASIVVAAMGVSIDVVLATPARAQGDPLSVRAVGDSYASFIAEASQRFGIPAAWIRAVMHVESAGHARAVSPKGAIGLMQIMPKTWTGLRLRYGFGDDPFDPHDNILAGAAYLRELHDRYGTAGFLAAYHCGPTCYGSRLATGHLLPAETRAYVAALAPLIDGNEKVGGGILVAAGADAWRRAPLFVAFADRSAVTDSSSAERQSHTRLEVGPLRFQTVRRRRLDGRAGGASLFVGRASIDGEQ